MKYFVYKKVELGLGGLERGVVIEEESESLAKIKAMDLASFSFVGLDLEDLDTVEVPINVSIDELTKVSILEGVEIPPLEGDTHPQYRRSNICMNWEYVKEEIDDLKKYYPRDTARKERKIINAIWKEINKREEQFSYKGRTSTLSNWNITRDDLLYMWKTGVDVVFNIEKSIKKISDKESEVLERIQKIFKRNENMTYQERETRLYNVFHGKRV